MIEMLPYYYRKSQVITDIYDTIQKALDELDADISELERDLFIATTVDFTRHEADVGLGYSQGLSGEERRARVISRLIGNGVFTAQTLKDVCTAYEESGVTVEEKSGEYTVVLFFAHREGQPPNIEELLQTVDELKPAHIKIGLKYIRNPLSNLVAGGMVQILKEYATPLIDISRADTIHGSVYMGGTIRTKRDIILQEVCYE